MGDSSKEEESKSNEPLPSPAPWSGTPKASSPGTSKQQAQHEKLKEYEARRRLAYTSKFDSISLYWKSYRDLLSASLSETGRAHRLILGTCKAHQIYSDAMSAMYRDTYIDEKGNVTTEKQRKRLGASRKPEFRQWRSGEGNKQTPVLKEIRDCQKELAEKLDENAKNMDNEIAAEIGSLLQELKQQFAQMEQLGSCILTELEKTEQEVVQSWGTYLRGQSSLGTTSPGISSASPQETAPRTGEAVDPWLVEMQYRVTVAYQNSAWEKGSAELTNLFAKIKQEEILRRMNLREFLVAFVQRQERVFVSIPSLHNSVLDDLMGKEMSKEEMEEDFRAAITARTQKLKKNNSVPGAQWETTDDDMKIESPLASDLLVKAKIVWRKGAGTVTTGQRTSLAIITADYYLHLFDVDGDKVKPGDSPDTAFQMLSPTVVMPTHENYMMGVSNFNKGWSDSLMLSDSIILGNTTVQQRDDTSFELTEVVESKGASKMFVKSAKKKVLIITASKEEKDEWMTILTT